MRKGLPPSFSEGRVFPRGGKRGLQKGTILTSGAVVKNMYFVCGVLRISNNRPGGRTFKTQRLAVMTAGTIALMPFILALLVDGFVRRRIREAEYHAPSPTWWTASLSLQLLAVCLGMVAIMHPNYPPQWLSVFPVAFALAARMTAATWHRFI